MSQCIVCTRPDRGVSVIHPTPECMGFLTNGGAPAFYAGRLLNRSWEIEKLVRDPAWHPVLSASQRERLAARWIDSFMHGGCTTAEALALIRDKDADDGFTGHEVWDKSELPDRWFRDAWRRSHNGGPIEIDIGQARQVQCRQIQRFLDTERVKVKWKAAYGVADACRRLKAIDSVDTLALGSATQAVGDERALRTIWPQLD